MPPRFRPFGEGTYVDGTEWSPQLSPTASFRIDLTSRSVEGVLRDRLARELDGESFIPENVGRAVEILVDALDVGIVFTIEDFGGYRRRPTLRLDVETHGNWDHEIGDVIRDVLRDRVPYAVEVEVHVSHHERAIVHGLGRQIGTTTRERSPVRRELNRQRREPAVEAQPAPTRFEREEVV